MIEGITLSHVFNEERCIKCAAARASTQPCITISLDHPVYQPFDAVKFAHVDFKRMYMFDKAAGLVKSSKDRSLEKEYADYVRGMILEMHYQSFENDFAKSELPYHDIRVLRDLGPGFSRPEAPMEVKSMEIFRALGTPTWPMSGDTETLPRSVKNIRKSGGIPWDVAHCWVVIKGFYHVTSIYKWYDRDILLPLWLLKL